MKAIEASNKEVVGKITLSAETSMVDEEVVKEPIASKVTVVLA